MFRIVFLFILLNGFLVSSIWGQTEVGDGVSEVVYLKDQTVGAGFYARGYFFDFQLGKKMDGSTRSKLYFGFSNLRHFKEAKSFNPVFEDARGYYFGKLNAFWQLKAGYGFQREFTRKLQKNGVAVLGTFMSGVSLGMLKPVYLEIIRFEDGDPILRTEKYDASQGIEEIFGRAPWVKGIGEIVPKPGIFVRSEIEFEYAPYKESIQSIIVGCEYQWYPSAVEIMTLSQDQRAFLRLFLGFRFGKKTIR